MRKTLSTAIFLVLCGWGIEVRAHTTNVNRSLWVQLNAGFVGWLNTQCSNIFSDPVFRNLVRCMLMKMVVDNDTANCRCKEPPNDCSISTTTPLKNLAPSGGISIPIPGKGNIVINQFYITNWIVNGISCSISAIDSAATACPGYYPSFDELRISGTIDLTFNMRLVVDQTSVGGGAADVYTARGRIIGNPIQIGIALFIRHLEGFLSPSLSACTGRDLQDVGLSLVRFYIGNPARITIRWTSVPAQDILRKFVAFIDAQIRYLALNQDIVAAVRPYVGPASIFDLSDFVGTDTIQNPATTRPCREGGKIGHPLGGNIWFDIGLETAWCYSGGGILMTGGINVDIDYDDVPGVGDPGTLGCGCPNVSGGGNPCGGSNICAAIHCSFFRRLWCLILNERALNIEDPPGSGLPISRDTSGTFGGIMNTLGSCEQWEIILPKIKSYCPDGSNYPIGIRVVPRNCGSVSCGGTMQRPGAGSLVNYPVDLRFYAPLDLEFWLKENGTTWRRLFSFWVDLNLGVNLAWWFCATGGGSPCQSWHRVAYIGVVIDPNITSVQQDPTLPGYPPGGWAQSIADLLAVLLHGNLFAGAYVGIGLKPIIDPDDVLANPPNLDPVPAATYTPGSFAEPNLASSIDVAGGFLRLRWNIRGQLTAQWLGRWLDDQIGIAPPFRPLRPHKVGKTYVYYSKPTWEKLEVVAYSDSIENPYFVWRLDGGVWRGPEPTGQLTFGPFIEGKHRLEIAAIDVGTGAYSQPAVIEFEIDSVPPSVKTNIKEIMPKSFVLYVDVYDFVSKDDVEISWSLNDGEWTGWTKQRTFKINAVEGENIIRIKARDKAGNTSMYSQKFIAIENSNMGCSGVF